MRRRSLDEPNQMTITVEATTRNWMLTVSRGKEIGVSELIETLLLKHKDEIEAYERGDK